jgi:hypothetical protein
MLKYAITLLSAGSEDPILGFFKSYIFKEFLGEDLDKGFPSILKAKKKGYISVTLSSAII